MLFDFLELLSDFCHHKGVTVLTLYVLFFELKLLDKNAQSLKIDKKIFKSLYYYLGISSLLS
jgi:hypothetical protein